MIKRTTSVSVRFNNSDLDDIESHLHKFKDASTAIRELCKLGHQVLQYEEMMKDPTKSKEFAEKMQEVIQTENFDQFAQTLQTEQIDGFLMFLQMEKERRFEQRQLN